MQLKTVLKQKGYKVKDLYDRVSLKRRRNGRGMVITAESR